MPLEHYYSHDGLPPAAAVRNALSDLTDDGVSKSSPVSEGASELAVTKTRSDGKSYVVVREEGHDGTWTKTSERAVRRAVKSVDSITELAESSGGYDG